MSENTQIAPLDAPICSASLDLRINAARTAVKKLREEIKRMEKENKDAKRQMPKKEQKQAIAARPRRLEIFHAVANGKTYKEVGVEYGMSGGRARQIVLMEWRRANRDHYVMYKGEVSALRANPLPNAEPIPRGRQRHSDTRKIMITTPQVEQKGESPLGSGTCSVS